MKGQRTKNVNEGMHRSRYRLGELPLHVVTVNEGASAYIDTVNGRYWLCSGDVVLYDADWNAIDVQRACPAEEGCDEVVS